MQEDIKMQFKFIDSKMKEIYFSPIKVESETVESDNVFWNTMNMLAYQNIAFQQVKFA